MKKLLLAALAAITFGGTSFAWEIAAMNRVVDQTNFIVGGGCSGTLISAEHRLILTAHHCVSSYIKNYTRDEIGEGGKVEKVTYERRNRVTVSQKDYAKYETVGAVSYQTDILAYNQSRDLALLQLVGDNLRSDTAAPILLKDAEVMRGEAVFAVGNPLGYDATITAGIVSSTNRTFKVRWALNEMVPLIQFDANVNGGNSGGALYRNDGMLIGVVVAGVRGSDLSFAIPVFELYPLLDSVCMASLYDAEADDELCNNPPEEDEGDD